MAVRSSKCKGTSLRNSRSRRFNFPMLPRGRCPLRVKSCREQMRKVGNLENAPGGVGLVGRLPGFAALRDFQPWASTRSRPNAGDANDRFEYHGLKQGRAQWPNVTLAVTTTIKRFR